MIKHGSRRSYQRYCLVQTLIPLPHRDAVDRDPAAHTEFQLTVADLEAADDHVEVRTSQRANHTDASGVSPTRFGLQISDPLLSGDLGCTGHRSRWESGIEHLSGCHPRVKFPAYGRNKMPNARMRLDLQQIVNRDSAGSTNPGQVIAHQVDDHDVLGGILRRGAQCHRPTIVGASGRRALDRGGHDRTTPDPQEELRAEACDHAWRTVARRPGDQATKGRSQLITELPENLGGAVAHLRVQPDTEVQL